LVDFRKKTERVNGEEGDKLWSLFMAVCSWAWISVCQRVSTVLPRPSTCSRPWQGEAAAGEVERGVSLPLALIDVVLPPEHRRTAFHSNPKFTATVDPYPSSP